MRERQSAGRAPLVTLRDVADAAGVSIATASRAIAGVPTVTPELASRVFAAAERLGYRLNAAALATAGGGSNIVGLVGDTTSDPYFAELAAGVAELAGERGCIVMMAGSSDGDLGKVVHSLVGFMPRAMVIASRDSAVRRLGDDPILDQYRGDRGGVSTIGPGADWAPTIGADDALGAARLAEAIRERGYRMPLILSAPGQFPVAAGRASALRESVAGWAASVATVEGRGLDRDAGYRAIQQLLAEGKPAFDVVLAVGDMLAIGAMSALRDAGVAPGSAVGVCGFDGLQPARDSVPGLTSVNTWLRQAGRLALGLALGEVSESQALPLPTIIVRDSTPPRRPGEERT